MKPFKYILQKVGQHFFEFNTENKYEEYYLHKTNLTKETNIKKWFIEEKAYNSIIGGLEWNLEFCYHFPETCVIEPSLGYAVYKRKLVKESLWHRYVHKHLSKPNYIKYKFIPKEIIEIDCAISLHYGAWNYWHFHNDVLGGIALANDLKIPSDTPIIVPEKLKSTAFFQEFLNNSDKIKAMNWVFQKHNQAIRVRKSYFIVTAFSHRKNYESILNFLDNDVKHIIKQNANDKIFVTRAKHWGRTISNLDEIERIAIKFGFEIINCDNLSYLDQIRKFSEARYCVGIHGAALTNIIYRFLGGREMAFMEIFPDFWINPVYYLIAHQYGYNYIGITGCKKDVSDLFYLCPKKFEQKLNMLLDF